MADVDWPVAVYQQRPGDHFAAQLRSTIGAAGWAVNVGGFGLLPGSLANLIALRMAGDRRIWWRFHIYSLPMLLWAALVGYGLLQL